MSQQKTKITENMKLAKVALIACIILALVVIAPMKLKGKRNDALDVFMDGTYDKFRSSVSTSLQKISNYTNDFLTVCEMEIDGDNDGIKAMRESKETIDKSDDIAERLNAVSVIEDNREKVFQSLSESGKSKCKDYNINLNGEIEAFPQNAYFKKAHDYNREIDSFPASLIAAVFGYGELPTGGY